MKRLIPLVSFTLGIFLAPAVLAAPLEFKNRGGEEALQILREHGLLEGYSRGGALKGDRAMSRWEVALMMARFLNLAESRQGPLLSRQELEAVKRAAEALRPEMEQLGLRLTNLEQTVEQLDKRVTEKERIRFKGQLISYRNFMSFRNTGNTFGGQGPGALNYDQGVGSTLTSNVVPHAPTGIVPSVDMVRGRPLVNGQGFSATLYLDVEVEPDPDWLISTRFYSYTSQGNGIVDSVWGAPPPYLANSFTGQPNFNGQSLSHTPTTQMGIERVRAIHQESGTTFTLGTFVPRYFSPLVFSGQVNPRVGDPRFLECFGFQAVGEAKFDSKTSLGWEIMGTYLPDGNPVQLGLSPYRNEAYGAALNLKRGRLNVGANYFRAAAQASDGQPLTTGLTNLVNGSTGQVNLNWVNPPQYFSSRLANSGSAGFGSTSDQRPIPGIAASDLGGTQAGFGPQGITLGGALVEYRADEWNLHAEYARSSYRPNRNSAYVTDGSLVRLGGGLELLDGHLSLNVDYRRTDPNYDPMILSFPGTAAGLNPFRVYHRFPDHDQFWHLYSLHDTDQAPHNRQGIVFNGKWQYDDNGHLNLRYRNMNQVRTSLQDVRYRANQLSAGNPDVTVLGFSPGFFDVIFREFSQLSFDANLNPLENPRGRMDAIGFDWHHQFGTSPFSVDLSYDSYSFYRPSALGPAQGGSQNFVDLNSSIGRFRVGYQPSTKWDWGVGYEFGQMSGHYDPLGVYNPFAVASNSITFRNRNTFQHIPFLEVAWKMDESIRVDTIGRFYSTVDNVPSSVYAGVPGGAASSAHPFQFSGYSLSTRLEINF